MFVSIFIEKYKNECGLCINGAFDGEIEIIQSELKKSKINLLHTIIVYEKSLCKILEVILIIYFFG